MSYTTSLRTAALVALVALLSPSAGAADTFNTVGTPHHVKSITFYPPAPVVGPNIQILSTPDYGTIDVTFANDVERFGVKLEDSSQMQSGGSPLFLPPCNSCQGFPSLVTVGPTGRVAYFYDETIGEACNDGVDNDGDGVTDCADDDCALSPHCASEAPPLTTESMVSRNGLLIRSKDGSLCVNYIQTSTNPYLAMTVTTVDPEADCMELVPPPPTLLQLARWKKLLDLAEKYEAAIRKNPDIPIPLPDPVCLTCPPWRTFQADMAWFDKVHEAQFRKRLEKTIKAGQQMLKQRPRRRGR